MVRSDQVVLEHGFDRALKDGIRQYDNINFGEFDETQMPDISVTTYDSHILVNLVPRNSSEAAKLYRVLEILSSSIYQPILLHVQRNQFTDDLGEPFVERGDSFFTGFM